MTITTSVQKAKSFNQVGLENLAKDFFEVAETQLAKMDTMERKNVIASIHATAESLGTEN
jgi:ribosomal protein L11